MEGPLKPAPLAFNAEGKDHPQQHPSRSEDDEAAAAAVEAFNTSKTEEESTPPPPHGHSFKSVFLHKPTGAKEIIQSEPSDFPPSAINSTTILTVGITNRQSIINSTEEGPSAHLLLPEKSAANGSAVLLDKNDDISEVKGKQDFVEWDVERVLEEQETHDLFCPKCKSCITKRVILRKRKRRGQDAGDDSRPNKIEILEQSSVPRIDQGSNTNECPLDASMPLSADGQDREAGPFIFKCLSCFSFFIPAVAGLFRSSRKEREDIDTRDTQPRGATNVLSEQEGAANSHSDNAPAMVEKREEALALQSQKSGENKWFSAGLGPPVVGAGQKVEGAVEKRSPGMKEDFLAADGNESDDKPNLQRGKDLNLPYGTDITTLMAAASQLPEDFYVEKQVYDPKLAEKPLPPESTIISIEKNLGDSQGVDITVVVDDGQSAGVISDTFSSEPRASEEVGTEVNPVDRREEGTRRIHNLEIVKSIVYGGLIESITSLGVVSSAAGGDASTLSILALGLANLVGGLPVIAHSLEELKNENDRANQSNEVDRYQQVLGQRRNFWIHAVVAVISYLVCGIVPIVTYGFSFRESDNKEYKLIAVAAASLFCVVLLSIGKAYVQKPPKPYVKTLVKFVIAGVMASGLSFAVGVLVKGLLEKLGLFEPSVAAPPPPSMSFFKAAPRNPAWASY